MFVQQREILSTATLGDAYLDSIYGDALAIEGTTRSFSYDGLRARYQTSKYGIHHYGQKPRFHEFLDYGRSQILQDGGPNVCQVGHMDVAYENANRLFDAEAHNNPRRLIEEFTPHTIQLVRFTLGMHDIEECTEPSIENSINDIPKGKKTDQDRIDGRGVRKQLYNALYKDIPESLLQAADELINHAPSLEYPPAHDAQEAAHNLGDFETGLRMGNLALEQLMTSRGTPTDQRFMQQRACALTVVKSSVDYFEAHPAVSRFAAVDQALDRNRLLISDIMYEL